MTKPIPYDKPAVTWKPKVPRRLHTVSANAHDKAARLADYLDRQYRPLVDPACTADAQILDLADQLATCLKIRRQELGGYPTEGGMIPHSET